MSKSLLLSFLVYTILCKSLDPLCHYLQISNPSFIEVGSNYLIMIWRSMVFIGNDLSNWILCKVTVNPTRLSVENYPSTHTTLFWHPYDVVLTVWTSKRRRVLTGTFYATICTWCLLRSYLCAWDNWIIFPKISEVSLKKKEWMMSFAFFPWNVL